MRKLIAGALLMSTISGCAGMSEETKQKWVAAGVVMAAVGGAYYIGKNGGGGGGGGVAQTYDYEWDWDQFYNQYQQLVWSCRGVQTAQFADAWHCNGKAQVDWRWPQK